MTLTPPSSPSPIHRAISSGLVVTLPLISLALTLLESAVTSSKVFL